MPGRATEAEASRVRTGPRTDFEAILAAFAEAADRAGVVERDLLVSQVRVRVRAAGPALLDRLWPALAHLGLDETGREPDRVRTEPDLTIALWDSASTGVTLPRIAWMHEQVDEPRAIRLARGRDVQMTYRASEHELVGLDLGKDLAVVWVPDHAGATVHVRGSPFVVVWHWWMRSRGAHLVHAGAVGEPAGGALIVGRGGSGKSTTCVVCLLDGMAYVSDDYALLRAGEEPYVASLYASAKLDPGQAAKIPGLAPALAPAAQSDDKRLALMHGLRPDRVIEGFPVRAVLAPRVVGGAATSLRSIRPAEALAALAPSTLLQLPIPNQAAFGVMAELVRRVPSFRLELGTDLSGIAPAVRQALAAT